VKYVSGIAAASIIVKYNDYTASQGPAAVAAIRLMATAVRELCPVNKDYMMVAARAYDAQFGGE